MDESTPSGRPCLRCARAGVGGRGVGQLRHELREQLHSEFPRAIDDDFVCGVCIDTLRMMLLSRTLLREQEDLRALERQLDDRMRDFCERAEHAAEQFGRAPSRAERLADAVARIGGSWTFVLSFVAIIGGWIMVNLRVHAFDPYPFILLNLLLSCLAALQAPVIMMSQNRAAARDRAEADEDFKINVKAELEVSAVHDKLDHLLHAQRRTSTELQTIVLEMLAERR